MWGKKCPGNIQYCYNNGKQFHMRGLRMQCPISSSYLDLAPILLVTEGKSILLSTENSFGLGLSNEEIHLVRFFKLRFTYDSNFQLTTSLHQWFSLIASGRSRIQLHCSGEQEIVCKTDGSLISSSGAGPQVVSLFDDKAEALKPPGGHLTSLKHWEESGLTAPVQKVEPAESQGPHTTDHRPWGLRTPGREKVGPWHPTHLGRQLFQEEDRIPKAQTVISFVTATERSSGSSWMGEQFSSMVLGSPVSNFRDHW